MVLFCGHVRLSTVALLLLLLLLGLFSWLEAMVLGEVAEVAVSLLLLVACEDDMISM